MRGTYATCMQSMKSVSQVVYEKTEGQTDKQTNKQTNKPTKQKDYTSPALAGAGDYNKQTREPLSKGDSRTGLIAFQIQLHLATLTSLTH